MVTTDKRHPFGPVEREKGKIEHIHHIPIHKVAVSLAKRHKRGNAPYTVGENLAVKERIDI